MAASTALALALAGAAPAGAAATQISLSIGILAQLTGLNDVTFSNVAPETDAVNSQNVCAWTNAVSRGYTVLATGSGSGSAFTLTTADTTPRLVAYQVGWAASQNAGATTPLTANANSGVFSTDALTPTCALAGPPASATLRITIPSAALVTMIANKSYTGSLTLTISPM